MNKFIVLLFLTTSLVSANEPSPINEQELMNDIQFLIKRPKAWDFLSHKVSTTCHLPPAGNAVLLELHCSVTALPKISPRNLMDDLRTRLFFSEKISRITDPRIKDITEITEAALNLYSEQVKETKERAIKNEIQELSPSEKSCTPSATESTISLSEILEDYHTKKLSRLKLAERYMYKIRNTQTIPLNPCEIDFNRNIWKIEALKFEYNEMGECTIKKLNGTVVSAPYGHKGVL